MLRTVQSLPLYRAFDTGLRPGPFPDRAASLLPGLLAATRTGLPPASDDELTTTDQPPTRSTSCLLGAREWLSEERSDEELANEELPADEVIHLATLTWAKLARAPWACIRLREVAEDGGIAAACAWLDERRMRWYWPPPELPRPDAAALLKQVRDLWRV